MVPEAPLEQTEFGRVPKGEGWFVVNAKESRWLEHGQPACMYHRESAQEDFLVLWGECLLLVEGEERRLKAWDFVHCPPWTDHVFVGAGDGPCGLLAVGSREHQEIVYPVSELAQKYEAGVEKETPDPKEAYAPYGRSDQASYRGQLAGS